MDTQSATLQPHEKYFCEVFVSSEISFGLQVPGTKSQKYC